MVCGFAPAGGYGYPGGIALYGLTASALALIPAAATVPVNGTHRLVARPTTTEGQPVADTSVVTGANPRPVSVMTDGAGRAELAYPGSAAGADTITATAAGQTASAAATWVVAPRTIRVVSPVGGSGFPAGQSVLVTGVATPTRPTLPVSHVTVNGVPVEAPDAGGRFFARVAVAAGANPFTFVATDAAGQTATTSLSLTGVKDRPGPVASGGPTDLTRLVPEYARTAYDARTRTLFADLAVRNRGGFRVAAPLVVAVRHLSDPTALPADTDGVAPDGLPYWDFTDLVPTGRRAPSATGTRTRRFTTPSGEPLAYELVVLARPNRPPAVGSVPPPGARADKPYRYPLTATDPDGDPVTFALAAGDGPAGMAVSTAGLVTWTPGPEIATGVGYAVKLTASDGGPLPAEQRYTVRLDTEPGNTAPHIWSTPPARVSSAQPYRYQVVAADDGRRPADVRVRRPAAGRDGHRANVRADHLGEPAGGRGDGAGAGRPGRGGPAVVHRGRRGPGDRPAGLGWPPTPSP